MRPMRRRQDSGLHTSRAQRRRACITDSASNLSRNWAMIDEVTGSAAADCQRCCKKLHSTKDSARE
jgi:hypothetical protein